MSVFDVRGNGVGEVTEIVFAEGQGYDHPHKVIKDGKYVFLSDAEDNHMEINTADIPNLILALQKAVELGWTPIKPVAAKPAVKKPVASKVK